MRQPVYPCKVGVVLKTGLREYDHYVGHILDVDQRPREEVPAEEPYVEYEMPINIMVHDTITSELVANATDNTFECRNITFSLETSPLPGKDESQAEEKRHQNLDLATRLKLAKESKLHKLQIKKIDMIYNPEYDLLTKYYRLPVFFKSLPSRHAKYIDQGFIDNGR